MSRLRYISGMRRMTGLLLAAGSLAVVASGCVPATNDDANAPTLVAKIATSRTVPAITARDLNGDGLDDLIVSDSQAGTYPRSESGEVYVLLSPVASRDLSETPPDVVFRGERVYGHCGLNLTTGDLDGDATPDIIARADTSEVGTGLVYALSGTLRGEQDIQSNAFLTLQGASTLGQAMLTADYDGDGDEDLIVPCPARSEVYVVLGPRTGTLTLPADADAVISTQNGSLGWSMTAGRFDGSGELQLAIAEPIENVVYIVPTGLAGVRDAADIASTVIRATGTTDSIRTIEAIHIPNEPDRLSVRCRQSESEQWGVVYVLKDMPTGDASLLDAAYLTLNDVAVVYGVDMAVGPGADGGLVLAMGAPAHPHIPTSNKTGQVVLMNADLQGTYSFENDAIPELTWRLGAPAADVDWLGTAALFARVRAADTQDLILAGRGAVLVYGW